MGNERCMIMGYNKNKKAFYLFIQICLKNANCQMKKKMNVKENESNERPIKLKIL